MGFLSTRAKSLIFDPSSGECCSFFNSMNNCINILFFDFNLAAVATRCKPSLIITLESVSQVSPHSLWDNKFCIYRYRMDNNLKTQTFNIFRNRRTRRKTQRSLNINYRFSFRSKFVTDLIFTRAKFVL